MNIPKGNLYILIEQRFYIKNKEVVKIGRTDRTVAERKSEYPKDSKLLGSGSVYDSKIGENELIRKFAKKFTQYFAKSREYYYGNLDQMITYFYECVTKIYKHQTRLIHNTSFYKNHKPLPLAHEDKYIPKENYETKDNTNNDIYIDNISNVDNISDVGNILDVDNISDVDDISNIEVLNSLNIGDSNNQDNIEIDLINPFDTKCSNTLSIIKSAVQKATKKKEAKTPTNFCKLVYETQPEWYEEGKKVLMSVILDEYIKYSGDDSMTDSALSRKLNGKMFDKSIRTVGVGTFKELYSYEDMKEAVGF